MNTRPTLSELGLEHRQEGPAAPHPAIEHGLAQRHRALPALRPGTRARAAGLLRQPGGRRPALHRPAGRGGRLQRHRRPDRPGREVLLGLRRRGAAGPQAQRQDRHPVRRRGALAAARHASTTPCGSAPTRSATRSTSARRRRSATSSSTARSASDAARARHAADRVGLPARRGDRGQGRQGLLLRRRLRRPHRERARRRRGEGELPAPGEAHRRSRRLRRASSPASRRSTPSCARRTGPWC